MTGAPSGSGRHRGPFGEHAKPLAAVLTGGAGLITAIAGMITLLRSDPGGEPSMVMTTTVIAAPATSAPNPSPAPPAPQWQGTVQIDPLGYSLATIPPTPDPSGTPDISSDTANATFAAGRGAARWTSGAPPTPEACAALILAQSSQEVTAADGDSFCLRIAHSPVNPGDQYAVVKVLAQGRDSSGSPYVRVAATVWPDGG